jgi:hypothetical protein
MNIWSKFGRVMLVLALSLSLGAQWALLQTVAWTGMLISYTQAVGLVAGVSATFDGKHPCQLCLIIKKARATESQPDPQNNQENWVKVEKLIAVLAANPASLRNLVDLHFAASLYLMPFAWSEPPPKPPPRAAVAALVLLQGPIASLNFAQQCLHVVRPKFYGGWGALLPS